MRHLLNHIVAVTSVAVAAIGKSSDDVTCVASGADRDQSRGHRSLIHWQSVHDRTQKVVEARPADPSTELATIADVLTSDVATAAADPTVAVATTAAEPVTNGATAAADPTIAGASAAADPTIAGATAAAEPITAVATAAADPTVAVASTAAEPVTNGATAAADPTIAGASAAAEPITAVATAAADPTLAVASTTAEPVTNGATAAADPTIAGASAAADPTTAVATAAAEPTTAGATIAAEPTVAVASPAESSIPGATTADPEAEVKRLSSELWHILQLSGFPASGPRDHAHSDDPILVQKVIADFSQNVARRYTICETGFYGGHSALSLLAYTSARLYEFDLCIHSFSAPVAAFLNEKFPGRFNLTCGNSLNTVPVFRKVEPNLRCDIIIVDAGKSREEVRADILNLGAMCNKNARVYLAGAPCPNEACAAPLAAWEQLVDDGCIVGDARTSVREDFGFCHGVLKGCSDMQFGPWA